MITDIQQIAESSDTAKAVFTILSKRKRFRKTTDLYQFSKNLLNNGLKLVNDDYLKVFKALEQAGAGSLIIGRKGNRNRFIWNYNLKDVAKMANGQEVQPEMIKKRGPGRPPKVTSAPKVLQRPKTIQVTLNINIEDLLKEFKSELLLSKKVG